MPREKSNENETVQDVETPEVSGGFDDLAQHLVGDVPEVQQHAVDAHNQKENEKIEKQESLAGERDSAGNLFDPLMHLVDDNGNPVLTKTGKYRKKNKSSRAINNGSEEEKRQKQLEEQKAKEIESRVAAETVQDLKRNAYSAFLGYNATDERHKMHVDTTTQYFVEKGGVKLSPLHTLMLLEGAMMVEAVRTEKGKQKVVSVKEWLVQKYVKFKLRKGKKNGARVDSGTNDVGKDNGSDKDASSSKTKDK